MFMASALGRRSGASVAPARNCLQPFGAGLFEEADTVAGVLEFVDVRPYLGLPGVIVDCAGPTGGAAGVQFLRDVSRPGRLGLQFDEDAAYFLNIVFLSDHMFVTQQVTKTQLDGFLLG